MLLKHRTWTLPGREAWRQAHCTALSSDSDARNARANGAAIVPRLRCMMQCDTVVWVLEQKLSRTSPPRDTPDELRNMAAAPPLLSTTD